jgi:catabolite regulation protein CreA
LLPKPGNTKIALRSEIAASVFCRHTTSFEKDASETEKNKQAKMIFLKAIHLIFNKTNLGQLLFVVKLKCANGPSIICAKQ